MKQLVAEAAQPRAFHFFILGKVQLFVGGVSRRRKSLFLTRSASETPPTRIPSLNK